MVLLTVPGVRNAFHFGPMSWTEWLIALVAGFVGVAWFEVYKKLSSVR